MKSVILVGGLGTRLSKQTVVQAKAMAGLRGCPILRAIIKLDSHPSVIRA